MEFHSCKWQGEPYSCDKLMGVTLTQNGLCRTFNMLKYSELYSMKRGYIDEVPDYDNVANQWSLDFGYSETADIDAYPRRTLVTGLQSGLEIDMTVFDDELDYTCGQLQGYKHPDINSFFRIPLNHAVVAGIKPKMIKTSEELRDYKPEIRQCYLSGEKHLETFNFYTQKNCLTECLANYTRKTCECVSFYMPVPDNTSICGIGKTKCIEKAKVNFLKRNDTANSQQCKCLPACTSISFDEETSQTNWDWLKTLDFDYFIEQIEESHYARLTVYYKDMQFISSERHELYGAIDFWANCGGLLGLFCGFSFTSAAEIIYYLTLTLYANLVKYGRNYWSGVLDEK